MKTEWAFNSLSTMLMIGFPTQEQASLILLEKSVLQLSVVLPGLYIDPASPVEFNHKLPKMLNEDIKINSVVSCLKSNHWKIAGNATLG